MKGKKILGLHSSFQVLKTQGEKRLQRHILFSPLEDVTITDPSLSMMLPSALYPGRGTGNALCVNVVGVASDAFALMGPLPFLPQLCVAQYGLAEADVGYYVGLFTGAYSLANFCTS